VHEADERKGAVMTDTNKAERAVERFEDLESNICDLRNMADIASSHIERTLSGLKNRIMIADQKFIAMSEREADLAVFSIYQVEKMAKELQEKFYAIWEASK
jgi:hypothetical protein